MTGKGLICCKTKRPTNQISSQAIQETQVHTAKKGETTYYSQARNIK